MSKFLETCKLHHQGHTIIHSHTQTAQSSAAAAGYVIHHDIVWIAMLFCFYYFVGPYSVCADAKKGRQSAHTLGRLFWHATVG